MDFFNLTIVRTKLFLPLSYLYLAVHKHWKQPAKKELLGAVGAVGKAKRQDLKQGFILHVFLGGFFY